jgi:predicted flap endonuclease-1-like 5' DNA nuclease
MQILDNNYLILVLLVGNLFVGLLIMYFFARRRYSSYEENIGELETENKKINKEYKKVEKNLQELDASTKDDIEKLKNEKNGLIIYVNKYDITIKKLKKDTKEKISHISGLNEQIKNHTDEIRNLENHMASAADTIRNCTSEIETKTKTIKKLAAEVTDLEKFNDIQILRAKESESRVKELWNLSEETDNEINRLKSRISAMQDNFSHLSGIGPKISTILKDAGVNTFEQLASLSLGEIQSILESANPNLLRLTDPSTWSEQARLAYIEEWEELEIFHKEIRTRTRTQHK